MPQRPQQISLQDVGQHGLKGVGAAVAGDQHGRVVSPGKPSGLRDIPDDPETVDLVRPLAERLYEDEGRHAQKGKRKKQQLIKKIVFEKASYSGHFYPHAETLLRLAPRGNLSARMSSKFSKDVQPHYKQSGPKVSRKNGIS